MARREQQRLTARRKAAFIASLAQHGVLIRAARDASPQSLTGALQSFKDERARDSEFARAWSEAIECADGELLMELHRRAVEGTEEPVYSNGQQVGTRRRVSDRLLIEKLRSRFPQDFAQRSVVEQEATVHVQGSLGLDQLSPESQSQLLAILEREARGPSADRARGGEDS
jgi:hypothetical protein